MKARGGARGSRGGAAPCEQRADRVLGFEDEAGDAGAGPELYARSLAVARLLKQYAHVISDRTQRGGYVDMDAANRPAAIAVLRQLGFRDAPRVKGFTPSGRHLRQDAARQR